jgi:hypothetical protein
MAKLFYIFISLSRRDYSIPLASVYLSSILIHRIAFLILLLSGLLSYNTLYVTPLLTGAPRRFEGYFKQQFFKTVIFYF